MKSALIRLWTNLLMFAVSIYVPAIVSAQGAVSREGYDRLRKQLIERVLKPGGIKDPKVLAAVDATERHRFVPEGVRSQAYLDRALPIGDHQTISSPFIVALMTEILAPQKSDRVLEIGTGSGYQAAILSPLVSEVYTIEIVAELQTKTTQLLKELGYANIFTRTGDGYQGWPEHAPFDKIIVTCSPDQIPQPLVDQLRDGGLMVIPVGERYQQMLRRYRKIDGKMVEDYARPTQFVPMTGLAEEQRSQLPDLNSLKLLNGDFEEPVTQGFIPRWYYEFGVKAEKHTDAPKGEQYITFKSSKAGDPSMLLQGTPLDGRRITKVRLGGHAKASEARIGRNPEEQPFIVLQFFDENRRHIGYQWLGPFLGNMPWTYVSREIDVPEESREAIVMLGLFGAVGDVSFDGIELEIVERR